MLPYVVIGVVLLAVLLWLIVTGIKVYRKRKFYLNRAEQLFGSLKNSSVPLKTVKNPLDTAEPFAEIERLRANYLLRLFLLLLTAILVGALYVPVTRLIFLQHHEHVYIISQVLSEPTCTQPGLCQTVCRYCGQTAEKRIPCIRHNYEIVDIVRADCQHGIAERFECTACGKIQLQEYGSGTEHQYDLVETILPTCTEDGREIYRCRLCGKSYEEVCPMLGHDFTVTEELKPCCTSLGLNRYECLQCGAVEYEELPEKHIEGLEIEFVPANCTDDGYAVYECGSCGKYYTEIFPADGEHDYRLSNDNPYINRYTCQYCDAYYETYHIDEFSVPFLTAIGVMLVGFIVCLIVHSYELFWSDTFRNPVGLISFLLAILSLLYIVFHICLFVRQGLPDNPYDPFLIKYLS